MSLIIGILLFLTVPVFYIMGLVAFIKWLTRGGRPAENASAAASAAAKVRAYAADQPADVARGLNQLAAEIEHHTPAAFAPLGSPAAEPHSAPGGPFSELRPAAAPAAHHTANWSKRDLGDVARNLDNINLILYLGAFLVVVSAGIFVGYNFSTLSGVFKTVFLGLFAAAFYGVGLALFLRLPKLRPAGATFTGIGLVLLPLVGLAAYNFTSLHDHRASTWFVTSLITLVAYIVTIAVTRQTYIAYLMAFTTLSTFESGISLFNLPVYWFGWAMATVSIILLTLTRLNILWEDASSALTISANIFVPVSLLLSLFNVDPSGLGQLGVTIGLAGVFYAAMARRFVHKPGSDAYWVFALVSLPASLGVGLWPSLSRSGISAIMLAVAGIYFVAEHTIGPRLGHRWRELLAGVTGVLPLAGIFVLYDHPGAISLILVGAVLINAQLALRLRQSALSLLAILSLLALPVVFLRFYLDPAQPWSHVAAWLLVEVPLLVWWSRRMKGWPETGEQVGIAGYLIALGLAVVLATWSSHAATLTVGLVAAALLYGLSITEHRAEYVYGAAAGLYIAVFQISTLAGWEPAWDAVVFLVTGIALYALGTVESSPARAQALRYSGLAGPFMGALLGLGQDADHIQPVLALATGGGLLAVEGRRQDRPAVLEVAGGILILAFNWLLSVQNITQTQAYTIPWAAYTAYLGYRRRHRGHEIYDGFTAAALAILTIPLAGQALAGDGQGYGLWLILEALGLVFLGMAIKYKLVTLWGVTTLVLEVLYQLRDFFYALPKYLISAALGVALLAVAIVMLQRRKGDD